MPAHEDSTIGRRFLISIGVTIAILIVEIIGGYWTGSLALLSDAAHVFMDVFALVLSYLALRLSALPADDRHTYGFHRLEVLGRARQRYHTRCDRHRHLLRILAALAKPAAGKKP